MTAIQAQAALKSGCCATWTHPLARLLLGDRLHPGGERTTARTIDVLGLPAGARVLDVGSGYGRTLAFLSQRGYRAIGLDLAVEAVASSGGSVVVGDAETPPFRDDSLDGIVIECVVSLLPDKQRALHHARRVLVPGGRIAMSDVTVERSLPAPLKDVATWSTCVTGALSSDAYVELLHDGGFSDIEVVDLDDALVEVVEQVRRRIALIEIALTAKGIDLVSVGLDRDRLESFRGIASAALDVVRDRGAGYRLFHATKR